MTEVQLPRIRRQVLGDYLEQHLQAMPGAPAVAVFRGEVVDPPVKQTDGQDDESGRVAPYVVLYDGGGSIGLEPDLAECGEDLRWTPSITIAAGFSGDCVDAIDRVCAWVYRWSPSIPGVAAGYLEPPDGFDPGSPRPDRTVSPVRFFVSTSWQLDLTT